MGLNERIWRRLPATVRASALGRAYGARVHRSVCLHADREMYFGTLFLRNRPALELMRRLVKETEPASTLKIAVLGCSIGAEVYSILWTLRPVRPDAKINLHAVDVSPEVLTFAGQGVYDPQTSKTAGLSIFDRLTEDERRGMFDWEGEKGHVKPWLKEGITWRVGDACDPELATTVGLQDIVVASNFLCHMDRSNAERCLRNLARLTRPGGYAFISGVDLDVRTKVAAELGWEPISQLLTEMHDGDPLVRADWPFRWWGLEPLDRRRPDWQTRYASAFRIGRTGKESPAMLVSLRAEG